MATQWLGLQPPGLEGRRQPRLALRRHRDVIGTWGMGGHASDKNFASGLFQPCPARTVLCDLELVFTSLGLPQEERPFLCSETL